MSGIENKLKAATLIDILQYRSVEQPTQTVYTFLIDGEREAVSLTYRELEQQAKKIATYLQSNTSTQARVLLLYPPGLEYISAFFGCLMAGAIAIPAYPPRPNRSLARLQSIIQDAQATIALTTHSILTNLERKLPHAPELKNLRWLATDNLPHNLVYDGQLPDNSPDALALLQYTSGSTAEPKGVKISHRNLLHNLEAIYHCFQHNQHSRGVIWLPPYHDMGLIGGILQPLYGGFPVTLMSPLMFLQNPLRWLQAISSTTATTSGGPNFAYDLCVRKFKPDQSINLELSSWDLAFNGAEPINYETMEKFAATFAPYGFRASAFYPCYGMAEATLIVSGGSKKNGVITKTVQAHALEQNQVITAKVAQENARVLVGCGQSLPDQEIIIVNPETLIRCQSTEVGEIWLRGTSVASGYWNQPEMTENTFNAYLAGTQIGPFLRTGDLGFIEDGELFVTGRLKDIIIINGRNHYPQDIEQTVEASNPIILPRGTASFSVEIAGEEKLIVLAEIDRRYWELNRTSKLNNDEVQKSLNEVKELIQIIRREVYKNHDLQPYKILLLKPNSLPKTSSGKIQRHACRASFLTDTLEVLSI
ncbi:Long-chain-fatty-acid--(acyl-carrier-protein)lig ase [Stanieria cyanosphaera PCC 7437]|uniref:Long-chain-fatty-acid--(Acyl-carrier-protein)lig ase n=1 Tax=Stanieria cyanosphaera (strain ATCC 29371 / PCC 7437) TaxID=111780 RepID=K9XRM6_STAC7|nr:fatty acyl-AMP ligase [Stanieria cyanosphaera]AFZ34734.1 Long-chain-fatty-acid--(acyl-carrier-protein)lig ase [Stanieria cyanosphaera PCC 7437]